ncbi:hypothetical protein [Lacrimispora sp.]|uniref:hypothetical protein n=1 Tax=Lacrimispora sp. TaxID=2719234 RepID=UPI0039932D02
MEEAMLIEILKEVQKKSQCILEIERITKEIGEALSRNDRTSVQLLLGMRQEEMDNGDISENNIQRLISVLEGEDRQKVISLLSGEEYKKTETLLEKKIVEKCKNMQMVLKRTIDLDRHISLRLAGKDSFYQRERLIDHNGPPFEE